MKPNLAIDPDLPFLARPIGAGLYPFYSVFSGFASAFSL